MITILYEAVMLLYLVATYLMQQKKVATYRITFKELLGVVPVPKKTQKRVWIHAVSVGEVKAAATLRPHFDAELLITTCTKTGLEKAKEAFPDAMCALLPNDSSFIMTPFVEKVSPDVVLLSEGDIWPNMLRLAKRAGAPTIMINGKISKRSYNRLRSLPFIGRFLYKNLDFAIVQTEEIKERMAHFLQKDSITVGGNVKFDAPKWDGQKEFAVTFGSTHAEEDKALISCIQKLLSAFPELQIYYVPRHPERFEPVYDLLQGLPCGKYSESSHAQVLLVDTMGVLMDCYAKSHVGVVCGSFADTLEGHDIFEPVRAGAVPIYGPYMSSQLEMVTLFHEKGVGRQVGVEDLYNTICCELKASAPKLPLAAFQGPVKETTRLLEKMLESKKVLKTACE